MSTGWNDPLVPLFPLQGKSKSHAPQQKNKQTTTTTTKTSTNKEMHEEQKWQFLWDQVEKHSEFYCLLARDQLQSINDLIT